MARIRTGRVLAALAALPLAATVYAGSAAAAGDGALGGLDSNGSVVSSDGANFGNSTQQVANLNNSPFAVVNQQSWNFQFSPLW